MLTKEECLKALCRIQCGAKRNKKCEDCKCFDTKINPWKCVENTNESLIIRYLIEEHFNPKPLKLCDLHEDMWVFDSYLKCAIYITRIENNHIKSKFEHLNNPVEDKLFCKLFGEIENNTCFEENRFYPIQIPMLGENQ